MYGEILRTLLNRPVQSERDVRIFALRLSAICFVIALAVDSAMQLIAFHGWLNLLRGWTIIDSRGQRVDVSLNGVQTGLQLADSLFKFDGPDASIIRRGNR